MSWVITPERILVFNQPVSRSHVLLRLSATLEQAGLVNAEFVDTLLEQEARFPSGLEMGGYSVAMPYGDARQVIKTGLAMAINPRGAAFRRSDNPIRTVEPALVLVAAVAAQTEKVVLIQALFGLLADAAAVKRLVQDGPERAAKRVNAALAGLGNAKGV